MKDYVSAFLYKEPAKNPQQGERIDLIVEKSYIGHNVYISGEHPIFIEKISHLKLVNCKVMDAVYLSAAIKYFPIENLRIVDGCVGYNTMRFICEALKAKESIKKLSFARTGLDLAQVKYLMEAVMKNQNITSLNLKATGLNLESLLEILGNVEQTKLNELLLSGNSWDGKTDLPDLLSRREILDAKESILGWARVFKLGSFFDADREEYS